MDQHTGPGNSRPQRCKVTETVKEGVAYRTSRFDLDGNKLFARIDQDVHFVARPIPPEIKRRRFTTMGKGLEEFGNHIRFKDSPSQGVIGQISRFADTEEIAQQTGIEKIEFRIVPHTSDNNRQASPAAPNPDREYEGKTPGTAWFRN